MRGHSFIWLYSSAIFLALISAATLPPPNNSTSTSVNQSLTLEADPELAIYPMFNGPALDQNSLLMTSVQLLAREAEEDINSPVFRVFYHSTDARYSSVGIFVIPPSNAVTIPRRLMVWGLVEAVQLLMRMNRFASVTFRITRDGANAGSIEFRLLSNNGDDGLLPAAVNKKRVSRIESSISSSAPVINNNNDINTAILALHASDLRVYCRLFGYDLDPPDIFTPVLTFLRKIAEYGPYARIVRLTSPFKIGETALRFKAEDRSEPPYVRAGDLVKAAAAVPAYMLNKGTLFSEVEIRVVLGEVLVAQGELRIQRRPRPGAGGQGF